LKPDESLAMTAKPKPISHRRTRRENVVNRGQRRLGFFGETSKPPTISPEPLTTGQRRAVQRRQRALRLVDALTRAGRNQADAAKIAGVGVVSLWRWRREIVPQFHRCGPTSVLRRFSVTPQLIAKVQRMRLAGFTAEKAWRSLAGDLACPKDLAAFLRLTGKIPASFLAASRITKERWLVVSGNGFSQILKPCGEQSAWRPAGAATRRESPPKP
jgi:hypothetical protein